MNRVLACAIGAIGVLASASALAQAKSDVGPFRLGMSFDEARTAAPNAIWAAAPAMKAHEQGIEAKEAVRLGGRAYDTALMKLRHGAYSIRVYRVDQGMWAHGTCESEVKALAADLEGRFGAFGSMVPLTKGEEDLLPLGAWPLTSPTQQISAGRSSHIDLFDANPNGNVIWLGGRRDEHITVVINGRFLGRSSPFWPMSCLASAAVVWNPALPEDWLDFSRLPAPPRASMSARRHSFDGLAALPPAPASVDVTCDVDRDSGALSTCKAADSIPAVLSGPAERQAARIILDHRYLDPEKDAPLRARFSVIVDPADAKPLAAPAGSNVVEYRQVVWAEKPSGAEMARYYPDRALRNAVWAQVKVLCQIQTGGGLVCEDADVHAGDDGSEFENMGQVVQPLYRAAPTLVDGSPSAGRWVVLSLNFRPSQ